MGGYTSCSWRWSGAAEPAPKRAQLSGWLPPLFSASVPPAPVSPGSYFFYLLSGMHAIHLIVGIGAIRFCLTALVWFGKVEFRQNAIDAAAWFWHAMGSPG